MHNDEKAAQLCFFFCEAGHNAASTIRFPRERESARAGVKLRGAQPSDGWKARGERVMVSGKAGPAPTNLVSAAVVAGINAVKSSSAG